MVKRDLCLRAFCDASCAQQNKCNQLITTAHVQQGVLRTLQPYCGAQSIVLIQYIEASDVMICVSVLLVPIVQRGRKCHLQFSLLLMHNQVPYPLRPYDKLCLILMASSEKMHLLLQHLSQQESCIR